jgi:FHS family L-fucose permease-like MFS transporter
METGPERKVSSASAIANDRKRAKIDDHAVTGAGEITLRQSILPVCLVTILFFMWGFAYGLLGKEILHKTGIKRILLTMLRDVLNSHFQVALDTSQGQSGGLQAAYFGAYFIGPLTYSGWIVRKFGYRWAFIFGLCVYGVGALMFWPSGLKRSLVYFPEIPKFAC